MPAPTNVAEFLALVKKTSLVPSDRLDEELARLQREGTPLQNIEQLSSALLKAGLLTKFQSKQIKMGRYKRFEIAEKYRLLELLGVGGMGAVYLCEHMFMKRLVALKVLPVEKLQDPSALHRFYREARAVAALDHPNIVRAYDIDKFEAIHFLVMEYVDGASVQEIVARYGPISVNRAMNYVAQSAHGLHHAHQLGMVHRDIKPGNLLLERTGCVKILDMGLARFFDQKHDNVTERFDNNCVLGTADYLAPEQAVSNVVDIRADIYALGGSLYFMLTGQSPFPDGTVAHKLVCHQTKEPKPVADFRKDVPADVLAILDKMMMKDPAKRYQTPQELYEAVSHWGDEAVPAPSKEMPDLCPLVLALTGHAGDKAKAASSRLNNPNVRANLSRSAEMPALSASSSTVAVAEGPGFEFLAASQAMQSTGTVGNTQPIFTPAATPLKRSSNPLAESVVEFSTLPTASPTTTSTTRRTSSNLWLILGVALGLLGGVFLGVLGVYLLMIKA
jgi:eukaryotic-like serine/threonine-protein kinase